MTEKKWKSSSKKQTDRQPVDDLRRGEEIQMKESHWLQYLAISPIVTNRLARGAGARKPKSNSLTGTMRVNQVVKVFTSSGQKID